MSLPAPTQDAVSDLRPPCASFAPSIWRDTFLQYASDESMEANDNVELQAQLLKKEVQMMFQSSPNQNVTKKLNFINLVQHFGISY
ncbi:(-)-germacrene D synthase, partial [Mucuna pruriens]